MTTPTPEFRAYATAIRARQGLPPTVQDPATLERVAAILRLVKLPDEPPTPTPRKRRRKAAGTVVAR